MSTKRELEREVLDLIAENHAYASEVARRAEQCGELVRQVATGVKLAERVLVRGDDTNTRQALMQYVKAHR